MNVLFVGDVVGPEATEWTAGRVRELRAALAADLVVVNGENCAHSARTPWSGFGITLDQVDLLLDAGVDVITSGNHGWDGPDADAVHEHPRVLCPANAHGRPGKGAVTLEAAGEPVTVINLAGESALAGVAPPYETWRALAPESAPTRIVDFHSDEAWEKMIFATAIDGEAAAVLGTHTHEPTHFLHRLPSGTAFVADVGMTGPTGAPGGFPLRHFAAKLRGDDWRELPPYTLADGPMVLGAVRLEVEAGRTVALERVA